MTAYLAGTFFIVIFMVLIRAFGLFDRSSDVLSITMQSLNILFNKHLGDDAKEAALRKNSLRLFGLFFIILLLTVCAAGLPAFTLVLLDKISLITLPEILDQTNQLEFLLITGLFAFVTGWLTRKKQSTSDYTPADRLLHRIAFHTGAAQLSLSDYENRKYREKLNTMTPHAPVFITALPRAGTTMLLEKLAKLDEFTTHTYRQMPFLLIPLLWERYTSRFQRRSKLQERAHGDGMQIGYDSPEAFEEILWMQFWNSHYLKDRILLWETDSNPGFDTFFTQHMKKLILLNSGDYLGDLRYISKNNLNIARIPYLSHTFPDSIIIIPFRHPVQHANSLLKQHINFMQIHQTDPFAAEYMRGIGHFDFGVNLRPVDFDGWIDSKEMQNPQQIGYWLEYWSAAYRHLLELTSSQILFVNYDALCKNPISGLRHVAEAVRIRNSENFVGMSDGIRTARKVEVSLGGVPVTLIKKVEAIHHQLQSSAINH